MASRILTLCPQCVELFENGYRVTKVAGKTTTEKKKQCENCRQKMPSDVLNQYLIASRRKEKK